MKNEKVKAIIFMAICCDLGFFAKKLIAPVANIITNWLEIPGGVTTGFSLMFLVITCLVINKFGCGILMGFVQSIIALSLGMIGSMGALTPISYIVPGLVIDLLVLLSDRFTQNDNLKVPIINMIASISSCVVANVLVFKFFGPVLLIYVIVSAISGLAFGLLGAVILKRIKPIFKSAD